MPNRIDRLTPEQEARFPEWVARWTAIGLSTERMDLATFEPAVRACYHHAGLDEPRVIIPVPSPLVMALAAPIASALLGRSAVDDAVRGAVGDAVRGAVGDAVRSAVGDAVRSAVGGAVRDAVGSAVDDAVNDAVGDAVRGAVGSAVNDAVDDAVRGAVGEAVRGAVGSAVRSAVGGAVDDAVDDAVRSAVGRTWPRYIGGQFWVGGWWWGSPAYVGFFREVCGLELPGDIMDRALAYQATAESACWWWPGRAFVMVSDRPLHIRRDDRGRLHSEAGPAIVWPDGFGVWSWHGVSVPAEVIDTDPADITAERITAERNAEVRRILIERVGAERYLSMMDAERVATDDWGTLWRAERPGMDPLLAVELLNSTPEPDGSTKIYWVRVPATRWRRGPDRCITCGADLAIVPATPHQAVAWGYGLCTDDYRPAVMS